MDGKLNLPGGTAAKVNEAKARSAAHFSNVEINDVYELMGELHIEYSVRGAENAVKFGRFLEKVTGNELAEAEARRKAKEKKA